MSSLLNNVIFCVLVLSLLQGSDNGGRWKIVVIAIGSVFINAFIHEYLGGVFGALLAVAATVAFVGAALVYWCEVDRGTALRILAAYFGCSIVLSLFSAYLRELPA